TIRQDFEGLGRMGVRMLYEIIRGKRPAKNQCLLLPVSLIVRQTSRRKPQVLSKKSNDDFRSRAQSLLFQYHTEAKPALLIARALDLSTEFFLVKYRRTFGIKFTQALHDLRIERAVFDLVNTQKAVTDIHHEHGFETHQSFNRAFFRRHHTTPTQFRRKKT
ncbi:MAG: helix-turn-helix domain-containing protein, partial [Spirochaetia bacterium]|nr:helix-turn-helix domain-containing protein [Spirochaetia bacterium]